MGERIGPYLLVRRLGAGGMGVVHEALDEGLGRRVALKVIAPEVAQDPGFRQRFAREARAMAALDSAHVLPVHAHGEDRGRLWLATRLVPDGDLATVLDRDGPLPVPAALGLLCQVADGLAAAHAAGVVHRDVKPSNVLLDRSEGRTTAYLGDFGLAHRLDHDLTRVRGSRLEGTPAYLAPELHTGTDAGMASDVYALGCLLWAALTGQPPYAAATDYELARAHLEHPVPQLPGTSPRVRQVNRILRTALAKDPARRYSSAARMRDDLHRAAALPADPAAIRVGRLRVAVPVASVVGALLLGVSGWAVSRGGVPAEPAGSASSPPPAAARQVATDTMVAALVADGSLTRRQAGCVATRWIDAVGLEALAGAGYVDAELRFVDVDVSGVPGELRRALAAATYACVGSWR